MILINIIHFTFVNKQIILYIDIKSKSLFSELNGMKQGKKRIMSFKAAVQLAAPHTWPSSIIPVCLGAALSCADSVPIDPAVLLFTLCTAVLLQSAVNTLNDYADFVSGLDTEENCPDNTDAARVYECSSPKAALCLGMLFLLGAAVFGAALIANCGTAMIIYGAVALAAIALYTVPLFAFSRLPLGEALSGGTMGGVLTFAAYHAQSGRFEPRLLYLCLPMAIMIGCIMLVNNASDIEKDIEGGRKTLPICVGRGASQIILRTAVMASCLLTAVFVCVLAPRGAAALPVMAVSLMIDPHIRALFTAPLSPERRGASMRGVLSACTKINALYALGLIIHSLSL